jgi:DNA polymerase-1
MTSQMSIFAGVGAHSELKTAPVERWTTPTELPSLEGVRRVAFDTETTGLNHMRDRVVGFSLAWRAPQDNSLRKTYLPIGHYDGNLDREIVLNYLKTELVGKEIVGANTKFDLHACLNTGLDLEAAGVQPRDVAFSAALLDDEQRGGLDLDSLGRRYAGEGKLPFPMQGARMADLPASAVGAYAEQDARVTLLVDEATQPLLDRDGLDGVADLENSIIYAVVCLERTGCRIDRDKLALWRRSARADYENLLRSIHAATGLMLNPTATDEYQRLLRQLDLPLFRPNAKGTVNFNEDELRAHHHPVIDAALKARALASLMAKFLDKFWTTLERTGGDRLYSQYHQLKSTEEYGTVSGRFSSSGGGEAESGYSFNAQQTIHPENQTDVPYIIRELFIPDEGRKFFSVDAAQIEYRILAHLTAAPKILAAYKENPDADFHQLVTDIALPHAPTTTRKHMKNVNFARLYGAGEEKIALMLGISLEATRAFLKVYDQVFPEAGRLLKGKGAEARERGYVTTLLGRRARFTSKTARVHSAVNRVIQGTAADIMKLKLKRVYDERRTLGITALRMTVHDELDGDHTGAERDLRRMRECFAVQELKLRVPIRWSLDVGDNWYACK